MPETDLIQDVPPIFLEFGKHEHVLWSPSIDGTLETGPIETLEARTALAALTGLVLAANRAQNASKLALSWREYSVGATAVICNFKTGYLGYLDGYNIKPESGKEGLNLHAEQIAIAKGRLHGLNRAIGIAVFADPSDEDANPKQTTTLRPCSRCAEMFADASEVDERTLVLGTNTDFSKCELYTAGSLWRPDQPALVSEPFALATESDLEHYDRNIQPKLIDKIYRLYS